MRGCARAAAEWKDREGEKPSMQGRTGGDRPQCRFNKFPRNRRQRTETGAQTAGIKADPQPTALGLGLAVLPGR